MRRLAPACLALVLLVNGCAETYRIRPIGPGEQTKLGMAANPLLRHLGLLDRAQGCQFAVTLNDVDSRSLEVLGRMPSYCLGFVITSGALTLPDDELQALIAHGLAHLQLGHEARGRVSSGGRARARGFSQGRPYSALDERDADQEAARLLAAIAPAGSRCHALGEVLQRIAAEGSRWSEWTVQHPLGPERADAARALCGPR